MHRTKILACFVHCILLNLKSNARLKLMLHAQGEDVFPIPGTKRIKYLEVCSTPLPLLVFGDPCALHAFVSLSGQSMLFVGVLVPRKMRLPSQWSCRRKTRRTLRTSSRLRTWACFPVNATMSL